MFYDQILEDAFPEPVMDYTISPRTYIWLPPDFSVCKVCYKLLPAKSVVRHVCEGCRPKPEAKPPVVCKDCGVELVSGRRGGRCATCLKEASKTRVKKTTYKQRYASDPEFRKKELERRERLRKIAHKKKGGKTREQIRQELLAYYATNPLKTCPKCKQEKHLDQFERNNKKLSGRGTYCLECERLRTSQRDKLKYEREAPARLQAKIERMQVEDLLAPINEAVRKEKEKARKRAQKKKNRQDPIKRMHRAMSETLRSTLRRQTRTGWRTAAGWTKQELADHIESLFQEGMSWDNYGEWHVDHIRPKSSFSIKSINDPEFKECWCLSNLQPLWASDNASKGAKWVP